MLGGINLPKACGSEEPGIAKVLFNTQKGSLKYQFTKGMWSEEPGMTKVLFDTQENNLRVLIYPKHVV